MDDFEKNFPEFDWKNTPAYKHPLGRDCPCPKHEYIREQISIAKMQSPSGWYEPGQTPEFDEYTIVLKGMLRIETKDQTYDLRPGQAIITHKGEWVKYSSPADEGAEYIAVCLPAFSPETVHRDY